MHDLRRPDQPMQNQLIEHRHEMRRARPVQDLLSPQPHRHLLIGMILIRTRRDEQRPGVLAGLEQARQQHRRPGPDHLGGEFLLQPLDEPRLDRPVGPSGQRGEPGEVVIVQVARLAPRPQHLRRRRPVAAFRPPSRRIPVPRPARRPATLNTRSGTGRIPRRRRATAAPSTGGPRKPPGSAAKSPAT
jgi:hypothetical protein